MSLLSMGMRLPESGRATTGHEGAQRAQHDPCDTFSHRCASQGCASAAGVLCCWLLSLCEFPPLRCTSNNARLMLMPSLGMNGSKHCLDCLAVLSDGPCGSCRIMLVRSGKLSRHLTGILARYFLKGYPAGLSLERPQFDPRVRSTQHRTYDRRTLIGSTIKRKITQSVIDRRGGFTYTLNAQVARGGPDSGAGRGGPAALALLLQQVPGGNDL